MKKNIKNLLYSGYFIQYKDISICYLPDYYDTNRQKFQVHAEHRKLKERVFSELYSSIDDAVDKFLGLKELIYATKSNDNTRQSDSRKIN